MSTWPPKEPITEDEYLVREPEAEYRSEYRDGRVTAMSGATRAHNLIAGNIYHALRQRFSGRPCTVFQADMRVKVAQARFYTYPAVAVVCGEEQYADEKQTSLLNPVVIFEVLSESTAKYDRAEKFGYYKKLVSLREYVLVSQERFQVEHWTLQPCDEWVLGVLEGEDAILELCLHPCRMPLREIFHKVLL